MIDDLHDFLGSPQSKERVGAGCRFSKGLRLSVNMKTADIYSCYNDEYIVGFL